jgi:AraC-like DNA-binding protein
MELIHVATFRAPRGRDPVPRTIPAGTQDVEIITGGRGWFDQGGLRHEAVRGTVLWHVEGQETIWRNDPENPYECTYVRFTYGPQDEAPVPRFSRWPDPVTCQAFADEILAVFHGRDPDLGALGGYAYHTLRWHAVRGARADRGESLPPAVRRARTILEGRFRGELSVPQVADEAGLSVPHLHALFRTHLGRSPHQVLMDLRMAEARRLLVATRKPVKEVAFDVGYPDVVAFGKVFRTRCGTSPARYRDQYTHETG